MSSLFGFIAVPLGWLMKVIYDIVGNYGIALLLFTLVTKIILFPLSIKQQKSTAKMSAYQPMIQDIQKKWANDKNRQQEELMKLQQEYGFSPTAGCLPMLVQFPILFGLIEVIYRPVQYILQVPQAVLQECGEMLKAAGVTITAYADTAVISAIQNGTMDFSGVLTAEQINAIDKFDFKLFGMLDLTQIPKFGFNLLVIIPILSAVSMIISQIVTMKMSGQEMQGSMKMMPYMMCVMFLFFGFSVPTGVSLYWVYTNLFGLVQSVILKKIYDPEKMKEQVMADIEEKKKNRKKKKQVTVKTENGTDELKEVNDSELARIRLAKARELEEERYKD
ncbi:MAG: YidC/Oxa1 family membrane protein insertase [Oscillospiraceae bacterium]|nr:YidC/Oxa1 family membrane protein insertase [Oscillospiraceae bacterium]